MRPVTVLIIVAAVADCIAPAQTSDSPSGSTIRVTTRLVQVNAVVHNKQDHPVAGLKKEDFEILDNGKPQPLAVFVEETAERPQPPALPQNSFTNQFATASAARSGYSVILLDWLNTEWSDQARARDLVIRMLKTISPADKVALCVLGAQLRVVHAFDSPTSELVAKLGRLRGETSDAVGTPESSFIYDASIGQIKRDLFSPPGAGNAPGRGVDRLSVAARVMALDARVEGTVQALSQIANYLAGVPGRKSLIWVTAGFPNFVDSRVIPGATSGEREYTSQIDRAIRKLNDADVAVYPVDARGLSLGNPYLTIPTLQEFAGRTGGKGYFNRNDLDRGMRAALDDQLSSYTLGYYAPGKEGQSSLHRISVRVRRSGITVRHKQSYFQDDLDAVRADATKADDAKTVVTRALLSPVDSTAIPVSAKIQRNQGALEMHLTVDAGKLTWTQQSDRWESEIEVLIRFVSESGAQAGEVSAGKAGIKLPPGDYRRALSAGLPLEKVLQIPANAASLRVLILDVRSAELGTLTMPLRKIRSD